MDDPPFTVFTPEDGGHPQRYRRQLVSTVELRPSPLKLDVVAELRRRILGDGFVAEGLALSGRRRRSFQMLLDPIPAKHRGAKGVGQGDVVASRPQPHLRLRVS